ncbi:carboxypeptidase-like regulatory domain-containing protein, partial [Cellulophaga fucicola]|uniref:carboxypeptidase-like regulatory domain-containing protein n=1 Tax=Cellulophaga fucicola TaxID=76595 RepID=UPI003EBBF914
MKLFLSLVLMLTALTSFSQDKQKQFNISGVLITADDNKPLESATVYLQRVKDSSLVTYTITDQKGEFTLEGKTYDTTLSMFISYIGYKTYAKVIPVDRKKVNLGQINLEVDENLLDEIVVMATAPVTVKKDTLEFNVNSFKTKKDANVEDLLKKLPGVEVDETGKITVNGKDVSNIFVNGKPFFGDDPTITTRNLTKDIIEKVQITDTKTKSEAFTGEESESDNKTINLTIKEDKNKGVFG